MSNQFHMDCTGCGVRCLNSYFSLCSNIEWIKEIDADKIETITADCQQLGAWCDRCGVAAALAELARIGVAAVPPVQDPPDRPCSKCGVNVVCETERHRAYVITEDVIEGQAVGVLEIISISNVCASCDLQLNPGGAS